MADAVHVLDPRQKHAGMTEEVTSQKTLVMTSLFFLVSPATFGRSPRSHFVIQTWEFIIPARLTAGGRAGDIDQARARAFFLEV
jgi:hypothetical protein